MKNIAIILARSGSKGLPDKNILPLAGKPLMAWTIEAALKSGIYEKVMVSTDSEKYAEIAREYGAEVPFLRSPAISGDTSSSWDAIREVLENYRKMGEEFDMFTLLQPTSPLRSAEDLLAAWKLMQEKNAGSVVSYCETKSPKLSVQMNEDGTVIRYNNQVWNAPRQALGAWHRCNGAIYMVKTAFFEEDPYIYREGNFALLMPRERSYDIDTKLDFVIAEAILKNFDMI